MVFLLHILLLNPAVGDCYPSSAGSGKKGVPVMLGNTELSQRNADPYTLTDVDIMNEPEVLAPDVSPIQTVSPVETKKEIITQTEGNGDSLKGT